MGDLLGKLALPLVGFALFGACSPDTGSPMLALDAGTAQGNAAGTGGYQPYPGETGGTGTNPWASGGMTSAGGSGATAAVGATAGTGAVAAGGGAAAVGGGGGIVTAAGGAGATAPAGGANPGTGGVQTGAGGSSPGGSSVTTGGAQATGGASSNPTGGKEDTGTGGEEEVPNNGEWTVQASGYVTVGNIKGYAWTAKSGTGSSVDPEDFSGLAAGSDLCVSGTAAATEKYDGTGILGVNLNQPKTGADEGDPFAPTGSGISIKIDNKGGSPLRLQVKGSSGEFCTELPSSGGSFDWGDFTEECWEAGGEAYDPSDPIISLMVVVPGEGLPDDGVDIDYEFCITSFEET